MTPTELRKLAEDCEPHELSPRVYEALLQAADELERLQKLAEYWEDQANDRGLPYGY